MEMVHTATFELVAPKRLDEASDVVRPPATRPAPGSFDYWWQRRGHRVEAVNQRRNGVSGVTRLTPLEAGFAPLYCKRQEGHLYRSLRYPLGRPTIWREIAAYHAYARLGVATPRLIYGGVRKIGNIDNPSAGWQALLVTEELSGFVSLEDWYQKTPAVAQSRIVLKAVAAMLARLSRGGWRHGCCYAKHVFVRMMDDGTAQAALLDLEKSRRVWSRALPWRAPDVRDLDQLARHCGAMPAEDLHFLREQYHLNPRPNLNKPPE